MADPVQPRQLLISNELPCLCVFALLRQTRKAAVEKCRELAPDYELASPEKPDLLALYEKRRQERRSR